MGKVIKATLLRSGIGRNQNQKDTLVGLGLTRLHKTVYLENTPDHRGMLYSVRHLVLVEAVTEAERDAELKAAARKQPSYRVLGDE